MLKRSELLLMKRVELCRVEHPDRLEKCHHKLQKKEEKMKR